MNLETYLSLHPKKYLIFDLDGTLAKMNVDWSSITAEMFGLIATFDKKLVEETPSDRYADIYITNKAIKKHGEDARSKINNFRAQYEFEHYSGYTPNKELIAFVLADVNKKYVKFIWTTNTEKIILDFLMKENLRSRFSKIISHNSTPQLKPEKDGFSLIYIPNTPLEDYMLIGDSINDEGAAKNARIDFFKIDYFPHQ